MTPPGSTPGDETTPGVAAPDEHDLLAASSPANAAIATQLSLALQGLQEQADPMPPFSRTRLKIRMDVEAIQRVLGNVQVRARQSNEKGAP